MAEMEQFEGVKGSYFITTDYVRGYYNPALVKRLCQPEMCPAGGHSVQHLLCALEGTCAETQKSYVTSADRLRRGRGEHRMLRQDVPKGTCLDVGAPPTSTQTRGSITSWRARGSSTPAWRWGICAATCLWICQYAHFSLEDLSDVDEMWVLPMALEDGIGGVDDLLLHPHGAVGPDWPEFRARWRRNLHGNAGNGGWSTLLVHPSYGVGPGITPDNLKVKVDAVRWAIQEAKKLGMHVDSLGKLGDFWRGRQGTQLVEVSYADGVYKGKMIIGDAQARRLSLEFGDRIASFEHNTSSEVDIQGRRVAFKLILPANSVVAFTAKVAAP